MAGGHISLVELKKRFGAVTAVDGISVEIEPGEFFSLLGPSGCGKTTTLRMVAGFEEPTSGAIFLDGSDVGRLPPNKRNVNTVFQNYALFPFLNVADNVRFGLRYQRLTKSEVNAKWRGSRPSPAGQLPAPPPGPALRWPAAAGGTRRASC